MQDGSTRIRKVVNSEHTLTEVEGGAKGGVRVGEGF